MGRWGSICIKQIVKIIYITKQKGCQKNKTLKIKPVSQSRKNKKTDFF